MTERKEQALAEEVLADARRQAERKLEAARRDAERILAGARAQADGTEKEALAAVEKRLNRETNTLLADLPHQERVRALRVKQEVILGLFREVVAGLPSRRDYDVGSVLAGLSASAISEMGGSDFVLEVAPPDATRLGPELEARTAAEVGRSSGRQVSVRVAPSSAVSEGGVVVRSSDGRQMVDQSFATRTRRLEEQLRGEIAKILFGDQAT